MKKVWILLLLLACICTFAACDSGEDLISDGVFFYSLSLEYDGYILDSVKDETSRELSIPESFRGKPVKVIGDAAFVCMTQIEKVTLPDSIEYIEEYAFQKCTTLKTVVFPKNLKSIDEAAFTGCTSLESVIIPDGSSTLEIGDRAFSDCTSLQTVSLPKQMDSIGRHAFPVVQVSNPYLCQHRCIALAKAHLCIAQASAPLRFQRAFIKYAKTYAAVPPSPALPCRTVWRELTASTIPFPAVFPNVKTCRRSVWAQKIRILVA